MSKKRKPNVKKARRDLAKAIEELPILVKAAKLPSNFVDTKEQIVWFCEDNFAIWELLSYLKEES